MAEDRVNFDEVVDRRGGDSVKWNQFARADRDIIAAWVADMDFRAPSSIIEALHARLDHGVFGYADIPQELIEVVRGRLAGKYHWQVDSDWIVPMSGVVPSMYFAVRAVGVSGSGVITQSPNYPHFFGAPDHSDRRLESVACHLEKGRWQLDFDALRDCAQGDVSSFLLCNPHNPVGRVLERQELETIAEICLQNDIMICADEIHCDLILDEDKQHIPIATLSRDTEQNSITLISPNKTFNLAGLGGFALAIIPNPRLRAAFQRSAHGAHTYPGIMGYTAALSAYRDCSEWRAQLIDYLRSNRDYLEAEIASIPELDMAHVEATYLAWIDVSALGLERPYLRFHEHGLALSNGGPMGSSSHVRLNFACPRVILEEIVKRIRSAVASI